MAMERRLWQTKAGLELRSSSPARIFTLPFMGNPELGMALRDGTVGAGSALESDSAARAMLESSVHCSQGCQLDLHYGSQMPDLAGRVSLLKELL